MIVALPSNASLNLIGPGLQRSYFINKRLPGIRQQLVIGRAPCTGSDRDLCLDRFDQEVCHCAGRKIISPGTVARVDADTTSL